MLVPIALPYRWTQQLGDVDITVPVPQGTRARDLAITLTKKKLSVGLKGQEPIMAGDLCQDIKEEESTWTVGEWQFGWLSYVYSAIYFPDLHA